VHPNTIKTWVRRGLMPEAEPEYARFAEGYIKAETAVEAGLVDRIREAAEPWEAQKRHTKTRTGGGLSLGLNDPADIAAADEVETLEERQERRGDWRAAAFLLERRFPKRWGEAAAESGGQDALDIRGLLDEAESRGQDLDTLLGDGMPPELEEAILRHKDRLLALISGA